MASFSVNRGAWTAAVELEVDGRYTHWHAALMTVDGVHFGWKGEMKTTELPEGVIQDAVGRLVHELMGALPA